MLPILKRSLCAASISLRLHHSSISTNIHPGFINYNSNAENRYTKMKYVSDIDLAKMMKDPKLTPGKDFLVVDVRDEDHAGGHIVGSVNKPSAEFLMSVDELVKDTKGVPLVIFHCALSQMRGPKAARIFEETRNIKYEGQEITQQVAVLRDGFVGFQDRFKNDRKLVEQWDKDVWEPDVTPLPENLDNLLQDRTTATTQSKDT